MHKNRSPDNASSEPLREIPCNSPQQPKSSRKKASQSPLTQSTARRHVASHSRKQAEPGTAVKSPDSTSADQVKEVSNSPISQLRIRKTRENKRPATSKVLNQGRESIVVHKRATKENNSMRLQIKEASPPGIDIFDASIATPTSEGSLMPTGLAADRRLSVEKRESQGNSAAKRRVLSKVMGTLQGMARTPASERDTSSTGSLIRRLSGKGSRNIVNVSTFDMHATPYLISRPASASSDIKEIVNGQEEEFIEASPQSPGRLQIQTSSPPSTVKPVRAISHSRHGLRLGNAQDTTSVDLSLVLERNNIDYCNEARFWVLIEAELRHSTSDSTLPDTMSYLEMYVNALPDCEIVCLLGPERCHSLIAGDVFARYVLVKVSALQQPAKPACLDSANGDSQLDHVLTDLEGMLGVRYTDLFTASLRYKHPIFPDDTHVVVEKICSIKRTMASSVWGLRDEHSRPDGQICNELLATYESKVGKTDALAMIEDFERCSCSSSLPPSLAKAKVDFEKSESYSEVKKTNKQRGSSHHLPRFSFESNMSMPECLEECPLQIPQRSTSYSPTALALHTSQSISEEGEDKARHIWHIMRQDSKGRRTGLARNSSESLIRLESADESLRAIRQRALRNKRSVGADTLRSFAVGARDGMDAPWL